MNRIFYLLVLFFVSCNETANKSIPNVGVNKSLGIEDMPNPQTIYDTIVTQQVAGNVALINNLKLKLEKHHFGFTTEKEVHKMSYHNCSENKVIIIGGLGIKQYFARSSKPERKTKDFYPDFMIWEYSFTTPEIAQQHFEQMNNALRSAGRFCNGKAPSKLVINKNQIFHLGTRAEMFRGYIEQYGEWIKNYR